MVDEAVVRTVASVAARLRSSVLDPDVPSLAVGPFRELMKTLPGLCSAYYCVLLFLLFRAWKHSLPLFDSNAEPFLASGACLAAVLSLD